MEPRLPSPFQPSRFVAGVCLLGLAVWIVPCVHAENQQGKAHKPHRENKRADTREIESLESQWRDAMVKADTASLDKLLADDFFGISSNGMVSDKQQYLHRMTARENQFTSIDLMDLKVRMKQTTAISVSQARVVGILDGRHINGVFRWTKVYGREAGAWRVLNYEATRVSGPSAEEPDMHQGKPMPNMASGH
jgi:ketosteroid isomerase-like protein